MNSSNKYRVKGLDVKSSSLKKDAGANGISSASILLTFVNPDFPPVRYSNDSTFQISEQNFTHPANQFREKNDKKNQDISTTVRIVRILGLMALISYMIVILFTWIYANMQGYEYFSAGEPVLSIKYPEWILGFLGIFVAADYLHRELKYGVEY